MDIVRPLPTITTTTITVTCQPTRTLTRMRMLRRSTNPEETTPSRHRRTSVILRTPAPRTIMDTPVRIRRLLRQERILVIRHIRHKIACRCPDKPAFINNLRPRLKPEDFILATTPLVILNIRRINSIRRTRIIPIKRGITTRTLITLDTEAPLLNPRVPNSTTSYSQHSLLRLRRVTFRDVPLYSTIATFLN